MLESPSDKLTNSMTLRTGPPQMDLAFELEPPVSVLTLTVSIYGMRTNLYRDLLAMNNSYGCGCHCLSWIIVLNGHHPRGWHACRSLNLQQRLCTHGAPSEMPSVC